MENNMIPKEEMNFDIDLGELQKELQAAATNTSQVDTTDYSDYSSDNYNPEPDYLKATPDEGPQTEIEESINNGNESVHELALNFLKENGLFQVPEDYENIDEDTWTKIVEYNKEQQRKNIIDEMRATSDPKIMELFDYVREGGTWYGYDDMRNTLQQEIDIEALNTSEESHQRYLIESYLSDGLDPNNPAHARRLNNIQQEVEAVFDRLEGEELAIEAKNHFSEKIKSQKQEIIAAQEAYRREQENAKQEAIRHQQEWAKTFQKTLNERDWSNAKKEAVISQFDPVTLDDGRKIEMWKYKFDQIWQKPQLVQVFMDFLSDLDPYTLEFKRNGVPTNKVVTNTIQSIINSKTQQKSKGVNQPRQAGNDNFAIIDPLSM
jgi:hypothetical protein